MPLVKLPEETPSIIRHLNDRLGVLRDRDARLLPDLGGADTVLCASDYAGEHADPQFQVLSYLFADYNNAALWDAARVALRDGRWKDPSTMQFKKLNKDKVRMAVLPEFLDAANRINGLAVTLLIHRSIKSMFGFPDGENAATALAKEGYGDWKPEVAEKLLRIVNFQGLFSAALTKPEHRYLWITDRDAITETPDKLARLGRIFGRVIDHYCPWKFREFGYGTKLLDDKTHPVNDLLSIPDLIAGAALEFNDSREALGTGAEQIQEKSDIILRWAADDASPLRRLFIKISPHDGGWGVSVFNFERKE